jgi:hypothetical protein
MGLHLKAISLAVPPGWHALLIRDQAEWLSMLLAVLPELNPAKQVWQRLRDCSLVNRCYDHFEPIDAWNKFT